MTHISLPITDCRKLNLTQYKQASKLSRDILQYGIYKLLSCFTSNKAKDKDQDLSNVIVLRMRSSPAGSPVFRPAASGSSTSLSPAVAPLLTVGASPNRPASRKAVVVATIICNKGARYQEKSLRESG